MARVSFTLRRPDTDPEFGSYLRYIDTDSYESYGAGGASTTVAARVDYDSALRADGLQTAPAVFSESYLSATSVCYGEVSLEWQVNIVETIPVTPDITGIVLVYSALGEPQTIAAGDILVESSNTYAYEHTGLVEGRWAYYSLFVHYQSSGGDDYYERAASLAVLVPKNYGSNLLLWERIPEYYRIKDVEIGDTDWSACLGNVTTGEVVGPLFKYLSIIGFDIDRMRTMLDYQMVSNDPALANTEHLDALAAQLGLDMRSTDLGGARLRNVLHDVGVLRRSKGTSVGTELFGNAVAGSQLAIDQATGEITVYSQRVNYITTPKNGGGITTYRAALDTEIDTPLVFSSTAASAGSGSYTESSSVFATTGTGASVGINCVLVHLSSPVPVHLGDRVIFSVGSNVGTSAIQWARIVTGAEATVGIQVEPVVFDGVVAFEIEADSNASVSTWTNTYVEYLVDLSLVPEFHNKLLLAERNHLGHYFDGDTVRGGWLVDDASSVSDYRWAGSADASCSIFAEEYERMKSIVDSLLFDVLPITEESKYTIVAYNAIPGF